PISLSLGQLRAKFETAIFIVKKPLGFHAGGGVKPLVGGFGPGDNMQEAVADERILRTVRVVLQFVVSPAIMIARLELPMIGVDRDAVEFVAPNQTPISGDGGDAGLRRGGLAARQFQAE